MGSLIPSEASLCSEFGTSRGPVRQAVDVLRQEGLIEVRRGRKPLVLGGSVSQPFTALTSFTEWAESISRSPGQQTISVARVPAGDRQADSLGCEPGEPIIELLRLRLLDGKPAMLEESCFPYSVGKLLFTGEFDPDDGSIYRMLIGAGVDLHSGTHTIDAVPADERDSELLDIPENSPVLRVQRVVHSSTGEPIEVATDRYRPGVASITISNQRENGANLLRLVSGTPRTA